MDRFDDQFEPMALDVAEIPADALVPAVGKAVTEDQGGNGPKRHPRVQQLKHALEVAPVEGVEKRADDALVLHDRPASASIRERATVSQGRNPGTPAALRAALRGALKSS